MDHPLSFVSRSFLDLVSVVQVVVCASFPLGETDIFSPLLAAAVVAGETTEVIQLLEP